MAECTFKPETGKQQGAGRQRKGSKSLLFRKQTKVHPSLPVRQALKEISNLEYGMPTSREYFMPATEPVVFPRQQLNHDLHFTAGLTKASI